MCWPTAYLIAFLLLLLLLISCLNFNSILDITDEQFEELHWQWYFGPLVGY